MAVHVGPLRHTLTSIDFCGTTSTMLVKQQEDQCGLDQNCSHDCQDVSAILLPCRRIAKQDFATRRQPVLGDAPALHFPPVKHWACKLDRWSADFARLFSAKDANGNCSRLPAAIGHQKERTAYNRAAEEGFVIRKNRRVSNGMKSFQRPIAFEYDARRVDNHQLPENRSVRRERRGLF